MAKSAKGKTYGVKSRENQHKLHESLMGFPGRQHFTGNVTFSAEGIKRSDSVLNLNSAGLRFLKNYA